MGYAIRADRIAQRCRDVRLSVDVVEILGAPLAGENLVAHRARWGWGNAMKSYSSNSADSVLPAGKHRRYAESRDRRAPPLATESPLPLLPSGSDGVHEVRDRTGPCDRGSRQGILDSTRLVQGGQLRAQGAQMECNPARSRRRAIAVGRVTGLAERVGFEPTVPLRVHLISSQARSTGLRHLSATAKAIAGERQRASGSARRARRG